jgi:predicted ester cyclase
MSPCQSFIQYALSFEQAYVSNQWRLLEPMFTEDAVHTVTDGGPFATDDPRRGRAAVIAGLQRAVETVDRRFDVRVPEIIEGPRREGDRVWMRFRLRLRRAGLPELCVEGEHVTVHAADGRIAELHESLAPGHDVRTADFLSRHDAALRPVGSAFAPVSQAADLRDLEAAARSTLVRCYGMAKGQQDIEAALVLCHPNFAIEAVPFRMASANREETRQQLALFFTAFPDFQPLISGLVADAAGAACWGQARMTHGGPLLGLPPSGKTATLPFFSAFEFRDGLLSKEIFSVDLAALCDQIEAPVERVLPMVRMLGAAARA